MTRVSQRLVIVFVGVLLLQGVTIAAVAKFLPETSEAVASIVFVVSFWIVPPCAYLVALQGRPAVAEKTLQIGRVVRLVAVALGLSLGSVVALLFLWLVLHITFGIPMRASQ